MKISIEVELQPFDVPTSVYTVGRPRLKQEGFSVKESIPLAELDSATLESLCQEFRRGVFSRAGRDLPDTSGGTS